MKTKKKLKLTAELIVGDCAKRLQAMEAGKCKLAICDPPYNMGVPYDAYDDNKSYDEYIEWSRRWLKQVVRAVDRHGSIWIFAPDEWVSEIDMMARRDFKLYKRSHVVWAFTFGVACQKKFSRSHCHLLYFTKTKGNFTFNDGSIRVPSARMAMYNDKRQNPAGKLPDATWMLLKHQLEKYMGPDTDTWLFNRVCGTYKERKKHAPNQIPVPLLERIVLACSDAGDTVLDPFLGTGSSAEAAVANDRNFVGIDVSKTCVAESEKRIAPLMGE